MTFVIFWKEKGELAANLTKGYLESEGVPTKIASYSSGNKGSSPGAVFGIYVEEEDIEKATKILEERNKNFENDEDMKIK